jgi:uncharacterized protein (TIGR03437 family)
VDAEGNTIFGTWLGGQTNDFGTAIAVDSKNAVYITGSTGGSFPTTPNAAIATSTTGTLFAAKLSADGSRVVYSTYLPGSLATASAIAVDAVGNAYVAGATTLGHPYLTKLSADGSAILYTTVLAGSSYESATAAAVDSEGNAIVAGYTRSLDFPVSTGVVQPSLAGFQNAFVTKLDIDGNIMFSTYLGGSAADIANALQTDSDGNIYVGGSTTSLDFPTTSGTFQTAPLVPLWNTSSGGFVAKLAPDGAALVYSSYVTSQPNWGVTSLALDASGNLYLAGSAGADFPVTESAPEPCFGSRTDVFVAHLGSGGALLDATYLGGSFASPLGLAVAADGSVLLGWNYIPASGGTGSNFSQVRFGGPGWSASACLSPEVLNSASLSAGSLHLGLGSISPGEFVTLTGWGIGPQDGIAYQPDATGQAPLELSGVQVFFDGQQAPLVYVQSRQVNALAPLKLSGRASTVITLEYNGVKFDPVTMLVSFSQPGLFRLQPNISSQALATNEDGTLNTQSNPAIPGTEVSLWGTGFGPTSPSCTTGGLNVPAAVSLAPGHGVQLETPVLPDIGLLGVPPQFELYVAAVYAGSAPTLLCGIEQINFLVPADAPPGTLSFAPMVVVPPAGGGLAGLSYAGMGSVSVTIAVQPRTRRRRR